MAGLLNELQALILTRKAADRPIVVGVTGIDTAGKSTLTTGLAARLRAAGVPRQVIRIDDFHRPRSARRDPRLTEPQQYYHLTFDIDRLRREVLAPIQAYGRIETRLRLLDLATDAPTVHRHYLVEPETVVLLEGVFLLRPELRSFIDLMVFLHIGEAEAVERALLRDISPLGEDVAARYRRKYLPAQREYLAANPPQRFAEVIIDNTDPRAPRPLLWPPRRSAA